MDTKYAAVHASPNGPGDARPTALQIVKDEGLEGKWDGKVIFITGCSSGLGVSRSLARTFLSLAASGLWRRCSNVLRVPKHSDLLSKVH